MIFKKIKDFILLYYNSLLLCLISLWLSLTLISVGHPYIALLLAVIVSLKLVGLITHNGALRKLGMIGLNAIWAVFAYVFMSGGHANVYLAFHFPLFVLLLGIGIALRGRFDGR